MLTYEFNYQQHEIKFTIDLLGREKVYLNNKQIAKITSWFKSVCAVNFEVESDNGVEMLKITRRTSSYSDGEYIVTLSNPDKIIEKQSKAFLHWSSLDGEIVKFKDDEIDWLSDIRIPNGIIYGAWLLYFFIVFRFFLTYFDEPISDKLISGGFTIFVGASVSLFLYWVFKAMRFKPNNH